MKEVKYISKGWIIASAVTGAILFCLGIPFFFSDTPEIGVISLLGVFICSVSYVLSNHNKRNSNISEENKVVVKTEEHSKLESQDDLLQEDFTHEVCQSVMTSSIAIKGIKQQLLDASEDLARLHDDNENTIRITATYWNDRRYENLISELKPHQHSLKELSETYKRIANDELQLLIDIVEKYEAKPAKPQERDKKP